MNKYLSYWRIKCADTTFLSIVRKSYVRFYDNLKLIKNASDEIDYPNPKSEKSTIENLLHEDFVIIIVFMTMTMETYIYDYSARNLGDSYTMIHLDKMNLISKWIVIPKIITGKEIDNSHDSFGTFKKLVKVRNQITHWKSEAGSYEKLEKLSGGKLYDSISPKEVICSLLYILKQIEVHDNKDSHIHIISKLEEIERLEV